MKKLLFILLCFSLACSKSDVGLSTGTNTGTAGSLARFAVVGNTLYTVTNTDLNIFNITNPNNPTFFGKGSIGIGIETIFPRDSVTLFIGSTQSTFIYNIKNPLMPTQLARVTHATACDPVVANENTAYVTLHSTMGNARCWQTRNELLALDINNLSNPFVIRSYSMTKPLGLALWGKELFVCDQTFKWFDATNPGNLIPKYNLPVSYHDVIAKDSFLICIGSTKIDQYRFYTDSLTLLSTININNATP